MPKMLVHIMDFFVIIIALPLMVMMIILLLLFWPLFNRLSDTAHCGGRSSLETFL